MVEIGKERGSAEVAGQRADAASSWNTLEGCAGFVQEA
jgi:hypothetical protein